MPVVIGQAIVARCFLAKDLRKESIVVSRPAPIFFIAASTSRGAGITKVPSPQRLDSLPSILATLGKSLSSASLSAQDFFFGFAGSFVFGTARLPRSKRRTVVN